MMKWIFKWLFRLFILAVVLVVVFFLSLDTILRVVMQNRIRAQTGMDAEIGRFSLGLTEPTITIKDFKLYNPPNFGGTLFLDIPEIHVEYDRAALARQRNPRHAPALQSRRTGHREKRGRPDEHLCHRGAAVGEKIRRRRENRSQSKPAYEFTGIDVLNVSIGTAKFIDLKDQQNNREQKIGIENCVMKNVKSPTDLAGLAVLVALRGGDFFGSLVDPKSPARTLQIIGNTPPTF